VGSSTRDEKLFCQIDTDDVHESLLGKFHSRIVAQRGAIRRTISLPLELVGQRRNAAHVIAEFGMSERQACKLLDLDRTSYRYQPKPERNAELRAELIALARQKPR
jgi:hypothetical protein